MIKITLRGEDPGHLREQAKTIFGLVDPDVQIVTSGAALDNAEQTADLLRQTADTMSHEPKKPRGRKFKQAQEEAAPDAGPEVVTVEDVKTETAAAAAPDLDDGLTLEDVRKVVNEALEKGGLDDKIREVVRSFKTSTGTPVAKVSQLLKADYAAVIAKVKALLG